MSQPALIPATTQPPTAHASATHPGQHLAAPTTPWRDAKADWCKGCKAPIWRGPDYDMTAFTVACDPAPLTPLGEALALLGGRRTHDLRHQAGHPTLTRRGHRTIRTYPAGSRNRDVLAEHQCGAPNLPTMPTAFPAPEQETATNECPF